MSYQALVQFCFHFLSSQMSKNEQKTYCLITSVIALRKFLLLKIRISIFSIEENVRNVYNLYILTSIAYGSRFRKSCFLGYNLYCEKYVYFIKSTLRNFNFLLQVLSFIDALNLFHRSLVFLAQLLAHVL